MAFTTRLSTAPLQNMIARKKSILGVSWEELGSHLGISSRTLLRVMESESIGIYCADHMAIRLGSHPVLLWPREWSGAPASAAMSKSRGGVIRERIQARDGRTGAARKMEQ